MKKIVLRALCLVLAVFTVCGLAACSGANSDKDNMVLSTCHGEKFRVWIPQAWTSTVAIGISGGYAMASTLSNVSMAEYPKEGKTLAEFRAENEAAYLATYVSFLFVSDSEEVVGERTLTLSEYTLNVKDLACRMVQTVFEDETSFYLFTFLCADSIYENYREQAMTVLKNIDFPSEPYEGGVKKISEKADAPDGMQLASVDGYSYRFYIPEGWEILAGRVSAGRAADGANIAVSEYSPDENYVSVADYWEMCRTAYASSLRDFEQIGEAKEGKLGGKTAYRYEFTGKVGGIAYHYEQAFAVNGSRIVMVTYTAREEVFSAHLTEWESVLAAFCFR